ncbi:sensor histidine kinase [Pedobacter frigoris]|uniref:histidine kinase n=1 Tax=Pedobacter frigoris TaxID=2571272 RepID=A0A4U1CEY8_9SPHI|nr:sensor histidine kinase [Pedobacter frigoris]TKC02816.1 GHKL domain-containing protein [Pedobacter frigoris]
MRFGIIFLIFSLLLYLDVSGQVLTPSADNKSLGKQITYFEDKTASLSLEDIKTVDTQGKFSPGKKDILNFGNTASAFWIKFNYKRKDSSKAYLIIDVPNIEHIDCYVSHHDQLIKHLKSGSLEQNYNDVSNQSNFVFTLPNHAQTDIYTVYLKLKTNNVMLVPIKLATTDAVVKGREWKDRIEYVYIGILIALLLFNLFLYISLGDNTYLYYVCYVLTLSIYMLAYLRGYGFVFGADIRVLINSYPHVFLSASMLTAMVFSRKFLHLDEVIPGMLKAYYFLIAGAIVLFFFSVSGNKSLAASISQILIVIMSIILWSAGIMAYFRGHTAAKYYIIAWFFILTTVVIVTLSLGNILTTTEYTMQLVPIGSTLELLVLSFALGDRYKGIIKKEQRLRDENLSLVQNQKQILEQLVEQRTQMLSESIKALESSNAVKNKLFSIIAHDLRSPLNSLMSILSLNDMDALSMADLQHMLKENKKNIENIYNTLNNLLHWAKTQMEAIKAEPVNFDLRQSIEELMMVYTPLIQKKEIEVILNMKGSYTVHADENQIKLILRNLIDNAIKFTPRNSRIELSVERIDGTIAVCIANTISDPSKINIYDMMVPSAVEATYGTENEKGVGLGLHLCQEYIRSNGGELTIKLEGKLISFSFILPGHQA